jgi:hypothetical protein
MLALTLAAAPVNVAGTELLGFPANPPVPVGAVVAAFEVAEAGADGGGEDLAAPPGPGKLTATPLAEHRETTAEETAGNMVRFLMAFLFHPSRG